VAPGVFETVMVEDARLMTPGEEVALLCTPCVVALDGEREVEVKKGERATIRLDIEGPVVVDIGRTMRWAMQNSILAPAHETDFATILRRWDN
jgi:hypothetical protein